MSPSKCRELQLSSRKPRRHVRSAQLGPHLCKSGSLSCGTCPLAKTSYSARQDRFAYTLLVNRVHQFVAILLILFSFTAPAMACMVPDAQMSPEERACCRTMKGECGQMNMAASHGCCQKTPANVSVVALDTKAVAVHPVAVSVARLAVAELVVPRSAPGTRIDSPDDSPPKAPSPTLSNLRI
jgi:hypothetical protein